MDAVHMPVKIFMLLMVWAVGNLRADWLRAGSRALCAPLKLVNIT